MSLRSCLRALALGAALAFPATAALAIETPPGDSRTEVDHGPEGAHGHFNAKAYGFQAVNFAVLLFILVKFGGGAMNKMLAARREQLKLDLEEASTARAAAEERLRHQETRLGSLEQELAALRASLRKEADDEKRRLVASAEERVRRVQAETQFLLDQQVKEAERRFREEVAAAALQIAEAEVRRSLQPGDEQRLVQAFVTELDRAGDGSSAGRAV